MIRKKISAALAFTFLLVGTSAASSEPDRYDRKLEKMVLSKVSEKMGEIRGTFEPEQYVEFITERDLYRGPPRLGDLPRHVEDELWALLPSHKRYYIKTRKRRNYRTMVLNRSYDKRSRSAETQSDGEIKIWSTQPRVIVKANLAH